MEVVEGSESAYNWHFVTEVRPQLEVVHAQDTVGQFQPVFAGEDEVEDMSNDLLQHGMMEVVPEVGY